MSDNSEKHEKLKGNTLLCIFSVILGCAVIAGTAALFKMTPAAAVSAGPAVKTSSIAPAKPKAKKAAKKAASSAPAVIDLGSTLFIGDTFTDGLSLYGGVAKDNIISESNLYAYAAANREYEINGKKQEIADAAAEKSPASICILLGTNDLSRGYTAPKFVRYYGLFIDALKKSCPSAKIYVQSVLPVTADYKSTKTGITNEKIGKYNDALKKMCTDKGVTYLNIASAVAGSDGVLPSDASSDGLHITKAYYEKWVSFLKTGE